MVKTVREFNIIKAWRSSEASSDYPAKSNISQSSVLSEAAFGVRQIALDSSVQLSVAHFVPKLWLDPNSAALGFLSADFTHFGVT